MTKTLRIVASLMSAAMLLSAIDADAAPKKKKKKPVPTAQSEAAAAAAAAQSEAASAAAATADTLSSSDAPASPPAPARPSAKPAAAPPAPAASPAPAAAAPTTSSEPAPTAATDASAVVPDSAQSSPNNVSFTDRALIDVAAGISFRSRHFAYNDPKSRNLRSYDVDGVPTVGGELELYPLARSASAVARGFGIIGDAYSAVGLRSATSDGTTDGRSTWTRFDVGLKYRLALASSPRAAILGASAQYGLESFRFAEQTSIGGSLPDATYGFGRAGLDLRVPVGPIAARARAAYLLVLEQGGVGGRFRDTSVQGIEGSLGVGIPVARHLETRLSANYTRFFYAFQPEVADPYVAGGAVDQMFGGELALAMSFD